MTAPGHFSDMPRQPDDVRSPGQSRHPAARPRLPFLDPNRTSASTKDMADRPGSASFMAFVNLADCLIETRMTRRHVHGSGRLEGSRPLSMLGVTTSRKRSTADIPNTRNRHTVNRPNSWDIRSSNRWDSPSTKGSDNPDSPDTPDSARRSSQPVSPP